MTASRRISAVLLAAAGTAALTVAVVPLAHAAPHAVRYTITSDRDFLAQTLYLQNEPANKAAYDADSGKYLVRNSTRIAPDSPFVVDTTLNDPTQWAYVSASAAAKAVTGAPSFHCEISVDGTVVTSQDADTAVTCSLRPW